MQTKSRNNPKSFCEFELSNFGRDITSQVENNRPLKILGSPKKLSKKN